MAGKKTGKRLLTWVLVLVMALSLLPLNALAKNVWSTEYGWIRIYLDEATKKDLKALDGLSHQVRIVSTKYPGGMHACAPLSDYWWTENNARKVTANKITSIDLAGDEAIGSSNKISIPIQGNETYEVKVSEGYHKGVTKLDSYSYLRIGNFKKCAVGKHPKSEKHGNTAQFSEAERSGTQEKCGGIGSGCRLRLRPLPVLRRRQSQRVARIDPNAVVVDKNIAENDRFDLFSR